jgi:hypothetical protein
VVVRAAHAPIGYTRTSSIPEEEVRRDLRDDPGSTPFVLTAIGLGFVIVGVYVVSNVWKEPYYDVMLAWDPEAMPADWEAGRRHYFTLNWIQLTATWAAFGLFLVALVAL